MLTRFVYRQLILFGIISVITAIALGLYYLRVPTAMGIGQYTLKADLPTSGGLYKTANVTIAVKPSARSPQSSRPRPACRRP